MTVALLRWNAAYPVHSMQHLLFACRSCRLKHVHVSSRNSPSLSIVLQIYHLLNRNFKHDGSRESIHIKIPPVSDLGVKSRCTSPSVGFVRQLNVEDEPLFSPHALGYITTDRFYSSRSDLFLDLNTSKTSISLSEE